jgi:predicted small metal-binding protein
MSYLKFDCNCTWQIEGAESAEVLAKLFLVLETPI